MKHPAKVTVPDVVIVLIIKSDVTKKAMKAIFKPVQEVNGQIQKRVMPLVMIMKTLFVVIAIMILQHVIMNQMELVISGLVIMAPNEEITHVQMRIPV